MISCPVCNTDNPEPANCCTNCGETLIGLRADRDIDTAEYNIVHGEIAVAQATLDHAAVGLAELEATKAAHELTIARAHWLQGNIYYNKGLTAQASDEVKAALVLLEQNEAGKPLLTEALNTLGNIEYLGGDMKAAYDYYWRGVQLAEQINARPLVVKLWANLGNVSLNQGRTYEALFRYNKATRYAEVDNNVAALVICYRMLCYIYVVIGPLAKAMEYARRIVALLPQLESQSQVCNAMIAVGVVNRYYGDLEQAHSYLQAALDIAVRSDNKVAWADVMAKLGQVYLDSGEYERGYATAERLFNDETAPLISRKEAAALLVQYHVARRDFAAAGKFVAWINNIEQQQAGDEPERLYLPLALYCAGLGDWGQAVRNFELAIEQSKQRGDAYELGREYLEYARALARHDGTSGAQVTQLLEQAATVFRKIGATRDLVVVAGLLQGREATPMMGNPSE